MTLSQATGKAFEGTTPTLYARIEKLGQAITQSDVQSVVYQVDRLDGTHVIAATSLTVSSVVFNSLQTTPSLPDSKGHNFRHRLPTTALPQGSATYLVWHTITYQDGGVDKLRWEIEAADAP